MERKPSVATDARRQKQERQASPPWEKEAVVPIPFISTTAEPLSASEREGLPVLWAAHTQAAANAHTELRADPPRASSPMSPPLTQEHPTSPWTVGQPTPYETQLYTPPATSPLASAPFYHSSATRHLQPPLTPPDSVADESEKDCDDRTKVVALPGTMSSRGGPPQSSKSRSSSRRQGTATSTSKEHSRSLSKRVKTAFHDIFQRNPVDENAFESIDRPHWTED